MCALIGVDTGGTFTDMVLLDDQGRLWFDKAFSTPAAPDQGILNVLGDMAAAGAADRETARAGLLGRTERFAHGTTVATNALIERKGARVGLITTTGFEDTLAIARGPIGRTGGLPHTLAMDFIHTESPLPLVPKRWIVGVHERVTVHGEVLVPLQQAEVEQALSYLLAEGIESLAVSLIWSFRSAAHEQMIREVARRLAPDLPVSLSSDIAPRMGEFERTVTTAINAYIGPVTDRYICRLQAQLADSGLRRQVQVMTSSGGLTLPERVQRQAVSVVNSGPIGGLVAARHVGHLLGYENVITADMGGTSFDVGLIVQGRFEEQERPFLDQGLPVLVPAVKVVTVGAGGGSIASADGYRLKVGPRSAGAVPGPACYAQGGEYPTVTDALVAMGIIDPETFFGGPAPPGQGAGPAGD